MEKRLRLKVENVLNKQFNADSKGYSSVEVDGFLDLVINDYQEYDAMTENLGERSQECEKQIVTMKTEIIGLEGKQGAIQEESAATSGNVGILKRLTRLEDTILVSKKQAASLVIVTGRKARRRSIPIHSVMDVVFVLDETINPGSTSRRLEKTCDESYDGLL